LSLKFLKLGFKFLYIRFVELFLSVNLKSYTIQMKIKLELV